MEILYWTFSIICLLLAIILFWQNTSSGRWLAYFMLFLAGYIGLAILETQTFCLSPVLYFLFLSILFFQGPLLLGFIGHISTRKLIYVRDFIPCCLPILTVFLVPEQLTDKGLFELAIKDDYRQPNYVAFFTIMTTLSGIYVLAYASIALWFVYKLKSDWQSYQSRVLPSSWFLVLQVINGIILVTILQLVSAFLYPAGNEYSIGNLSLLLLSPFFIYQSVIVIFRHLKQKETVVIQHPATYGETPDSYDEKELSLLGKALKEQVVREQLFLQMNLSLASLAEYAEVIV